MAYASFFRKFQGISVFFYTNACTQVYRSYTYPCHRYRMFQTAPKMYCFYFAGLPLTNYPSAHVISNSKAIAVSSSVERRNLKEREIRGWALCSTIENCFKKISLESGRSSCLRSTAVFPTTIRFLYPMPYPFTSPLSCYPNSTRSACLQVWSVVPVRVFYREKKTLCSSSSPIASK